MAGRYISWEDVTNKYTQASKVGGEGRLTQTYITAAEDEIDAAVSGVYSIPFTPVPGVIRDLVIDTAWYKVIFASEKGEKLKKYIDDRILLLQNRGLQLTTSGDFIAVNNQSSIINYALDCEDPDRFSDGAWCGEDSRRRYP